jgi:hypothetical protein
LSIAATKTVDSSFNIKAEHSTQVSSKNKGPFIIYGGGWHRREMFFVAKILLSQPLKKSKI